MNCVDPNGELKTFASGFLNCGRGFGYRVSSTGKRYQIWELEQTGNSMRIKAVSIHYHSDDHIDTAQEWQSLLGVRYSEMKKSLAGLVAETGDQF